MSGSGTGITALYTDERREPRDTDIRMVNLKILLRIVLVLPTLARDDVRRERSANLLRKLNLERIDVRASI
jgi:hypothetical protein